MTPREELEHAFQTMLGDEVDLRPENHEHHDQKLVMQSFEKKREEVPAWDEFNEIYEERFLKIMREAYRHELGRSFSDAEEALSETRKVLFNPCAALLHSAFAAGALIGQNQVPLVKRQTHFNEVADLWKMDTFEHEMQVFLLNYLADPDVARLFQEYLDNAVEGIGKATGYTVFTQSRTGREMPAELITRKVWDIWYIAIKGVLTSHYLAGYTLGQKWKTADALSAMEGEFSD